ncbi:MAG: GNAT family N-acetyltransferase [Rhabdochlamydiaceae bacterium]|nr:GNAT family N-acetyltransferase [Candidatus Amphrikana amoebophyrae]
MNQRFHVKVDTFDPIFYKELHMHEQYPISYQENTTIEEENILFEGVADAAVTAKGMSRIRPFAFFIKDPAKAILAGVKGVSLYGCLYVDLLWVAPEVQHKGLGPKLIHECEILGRDRHCTFVSLTAVISLRLT